MLVRTHREAQMVQKELARLIIASVYYSQGWVFVSEEALEVHLVLTALLDLSATPRIKAALATPLFGKDGMDLDTLQSDPGQWDVMVARLEEYHLRWQSHGVAAMMHQLLAAE